MWSHVFLEHSVDIRLMSKAVGLHNSANTYILNNSKVMLFHIKNRRIRNPQPHLVPDPDQVIPKV